MTSHLNEIGLDPYQGFFHMVRYGHAALASDLIEEFRGPLADVLVLKLLRRKQLKLEDIVENRGEFKMKSEASRVFFEEFENKLNSRRSDNRDPNRSYTYAQIFKRQAHQMARVITGEVSQYVPFKFD